MEFLNFRLLGDGFAVVPRMSVAIAAAVGEHAVSTTRQFLEDCQKLIRHLDGALLIFGRRRQSTLTTLVLACADQTSSTF
jgi:hypothetical protein